MDVAPLVKIAMTPGRSGNAAFSVYATVSNAAAQELEKKTGLNLEGYAHGLDESAVRHILAEHGNPEMESSRGQVAIAADDFVKLAEWTDPEKVDSVEYAGKDAKGMDRVLYRTRENGHVVVVEEIRQRRKRLSLVTLWKTRAAPDAPRSSGSPAQTPKTFRARSSQGDSSISQPREPWEMTQAEAGRGRMSATTHKALVQQALAAGKPVPPEVLVDYPDLTRPMTKSETTLLLFKAMRPGNKVQPPRKETPAPGPAPLPKEVTHHGYGVHNIEEGDTLHFEAGAFKGSGETVAVGQDGATVKDARGREHRVHWHEVKGFKAKKRRQQQEGKEVT